MTTFVKRFCLFLFFFSIAAGAEDVRVVLLGSSDVHGRMRQECGGFFKLATLIGERRAAAGKNVLLLDCGDTMQGSFEAYFTRGRMQSLVLGELKYDCFIPGNHDFEYGGATLLARMRELRTAGVNVLAANLSAPILGNLPVWAPYRVFSFPGGISVGVIGLAENQTPNRLPPASLSPFVFLEEKEALRRAVAELKRRKVSAMVLVRHNGLYARSGSLSELLHDFPEIDAVLGGHSHTLEVGRRVGNALFVQPGKHGEALAEITLDFDRSSGRLKQVHSKLNLVTADTADAVFRSPELKHQLTVADAAGEKQLFGREPSIDPAVLALEAIRAAAPCDVVIHWVSRRSEPIRFPVRRRWLYGFFPYANRICRVELSAGELRELLAEQCRLDGKNKYQKCYVSGVELVRDKKGELLSVALNRPRYCVAVADYLLAGAGRADTFFGRRKLSPGNPGSAPTLLEAVERVLH